MNFMLRLASAMFFLFALQAPIIGSQIAGKQIEYQGLPEAKEGKFPVHMPEYNGVRQLLIISSKWAVVATYDVPEVVKKMDELSGGKLLKSVKDWEDGLAAGRKDWTAFKMPDKIHKQYLAAAREALGERKLDEASFYKISSGDDTAYGEGKNPSRVTHTFVSLGGSRVKGSHSTDYAHYSIIEFPESMQNGKHYCIALGNGKKVDFLYDEMRTVSRAIKVNQMGYLPDAAAKFAYLGAFACEFGPVDFSNTKEFKVVNAKTGDIALTGEVKLREKNPRFSNKPGEEGGETPLMYGEDVYEMDLAGLKDEGEFFISIPGVGRSWTFRHAKDAYGEPFYISCRGLFHQRAASALEDKHTAWPRKKSKMHDTIFESENLCFPPHVEAPKDYDRFDVVGASLKKKKDKPAEDDDLLEEKKEEEEKAPRTEGVIGGWYDAADWDRSSSHYTAVFDLLNAYEAAPAKFADGQLNIPESGNGVPDILDEAAYGIECWRRSQNSEGGVSGFIETCTHPSYDDPDCPYTFSRRTRWDSLIYAAAAIQLSRLVKQFSPELAARYSESGKKAFDFGCDPKNSLGNVVINARKNRGSGVEYVLKWTEDDSCIWPYMVHAKLQMFRLTGDKKYLEGIEDLLAKAQPPFKWRFSHKDFSAWIYSDVVLGAAESLPKELVEKWRSLYIKQADELVEEVKAMPYRQSWPRYKNFWAGWGASCVTNFNRVLAIAHRITGDRKYSDAIIANADFMFGANPLGMSWTTGMGYVYPIDIQHANSEDDGIMDPVPGITIYGLNGGPSMHFMGRDYVWTSKDESGKTVEFLKKENQEIPFYRCWSAHPGSNTAQCEFTVTETMASTIFTCATLLSEGWMPDDSLKQRKPRKDEFLFGYWPMP